MRKPPDEQWVQYPTALAAWLAGADPATISMTGVTPLWYMEFVFDEDGRRQWDEQGEFITRARWWPNPLWGTVAWIHWLFDDRRDR